MLRDLQELAIQGMKEYNQKEQELRIALESNQDSIWKLIHISKVEYTRHLFIDMDDLQEQIKAIYQDQKL